MPGAVTPQQARNQQNALKGVSGSVNAGAPPKSKGVSGSGSSKAKAPSPVTKPTAPPKTVTQAPKLASPFPAQTRSVATSAFPAKPPQLTPAQQKLASSNTRALAQAQQQHDLNTWAASTVKNAKPELPSILHTAAQGVHDVGQGVDAIRNSISHMAIGGSAGTGKGGGGGAPIATLSPSALAEKVTVNAAKDAVNLPAEVVPSTYFTGKAALQAVEGHPKALEQFAGQTVKSLVTPSGWVNHPLNNYLMVMGGLHGLARSAEAVKNLAGVSDRSALARPSEVLYGQAETPRMPYSKDPIKRMEQKAADRKNPAVNARVPGPRPRWLQTFAQKVGRKVDEVYGTNATRWFNQRGEILHRRVDAVTAKRTPGNLARQAGVAARNPLESPLRPSIPGREAVNLIAQGVIRRPETAAADLRAYLDMVEREKPKTGSPAEKVHAETVSRVRALLNDRRFIEHPQQAFDAAKSFARDMKPLQKGLVDRGYVSQEAVDHARLVPYAVTHMGAKHDVTAEAMAHDEARVRVGKAQRALNQAQRKLRDAPNHAEMQAADAMVQMKRADLERAREWERSKAVAQDERKALVHPGGKGERVTDEQIRAHMRANGVNHEDVAFVTHRLGSDAKARWGSQIAQALAETKQRTGEAFRGGLTDVSHEALIRQHLSSALIAHRHDATAHVLNTFALRKLGTGDFKTYEGAVRAAHDPEFLAAHNVPHGVDLAPMRLAPQFVRRSQLTAIKSGLTHPEDLFDEAAPHTILQRDYTPITDMARVKAEEPGSYALIAHDALRRLQKHEQPAADLQRLGRSSATLFRRATLPFSPKRIEGLPQETAIRLIAGRAGLASRIFESRLERGLNRLSADELSTPEARAQAKGYLEDLTARALGGQQSGQALRLRIYNVPDYYRGTFFEGYSKALQRLRESPGTGHLMAAFKAAADGMLHLQKQGVEQQASRAALGKAALIQLEHRTGIGWARALTMSKGAVEDFLKGEIGSHNQDMYGRYVDEMMGKWSNHSPLMNQVLAWSPFLNWYVNSLRFLYATLPADHPVLTGLLAASNVGTQAQRAKVGLSGPLSGNPLEVEGYEEGGVPMPGGSILDLSHYSPFGAVSDLAGAPASELPPLLVEPAFTLQGRNTYGEYPKNAAGKRVEPSTVDKIKMAFGSIFDTVLPGYSVAERGATNPHSFTSLFRQYKSYPIQQQTGGLGGSLGGGSLGGSLGGGSL